MNDNNERIEENNVETKCKNCESPLFKIEKGIVKCSACGEEYEPLKGSNNNTSSINTLKLIISVLVISFVVILIININTNSSINKYQKAIALKNAEKYQEAKNIFTELGEFIDSKIKIEECNKAISIKEKYDNALILLSKEKYQEAEAYLKSLEITKKAKIKK